MHQLISKKQLEILAFTYTDYDALICDGAIRSGKTSLMTVAFVDDAMRRFDNQNFIIGGRTVGSAIRNVIDPYRIMSYAKSKYALSWNQQKNMLTVTKGGIQNRFYVFGGKDKSSFTLVQGITAAGCLIDEVALCERSFVEQAIARCSVDGSKFWFNCNPGPPDHWFRVEWILNAKDRNALHLHFRLEDNPSLTPEIRARYESMYDGVFKRRYIDGEWCVAEGLVYSMWRDDFIQEFMPELDDDGNDTTTYYMSIDYGITNPFVALLWAVSDGRLWAVDEYCFDSRKEGSRRTDPEHYDAIDKFIDGRDVNIIIIDPSANSFKELINRRDKYWYKGGNNDVLSGISKVSSLMGDGRIMVSARCHELISEMGLYQWQSDTAKDAVVKEHDHACVSGGTMIATADGQRPISSLIGSVGTLIDGNKYYDVGCTRRLAEVVRVSLAGGESLVCTPDHMVMTDAGWVMARDLAGHKVLCVDAFVDVAEVTDAGLADVYNMTVDNSHAYVANGMVCHNCDAMRYLVQDIGRDVPSVGSLGD